MAQTMKGGNTMLKNYTPRERKTDVTYELEFLYPNSNSGYGFPCTETGELLELKNPYAIANYNDCMAHPEKFEVYNHIRKIKHTYTENAHGTCECGHDISLWDEMYGACECPYCGRWYNLFGQELNPPEYWEEDYEED